MSWWRPAARRIGRAIAKLPPPAILALGFIAFVIYAFPGMMTRDSQDQLAQGRAGIYSDDHPPAMAAVWGLLDRVVSGPAPMLVLQGATFLIGIWLLCRRAMAPRAAAWSANAILLCPPVLGVMAVIWKDCQMAGFLALGAGLLFSEQRRVQVAGLCAIALATAFRYNAPAATLPIVVLVLARTHPGDAGWRTALRRHAIATAVWVTVTLAAVAGNTVLTDRKMHFWYSSVAAMDIVGTLRWVHHAIGDDELRRDLDGTPLLIHDDIQAHARTLYEPWNFFWLVEGPNRMFDTPLDRVVPEVERDAIARAWWAIVSTYPRAYLTHRLRTFREVIGWTPMDRPPWAPACVCRELPAGDACIGGVQDAWQSALAWLGRHTWIYRPWMYLLLGLGLIYPCRRHRDELALLASGLASEAGLFFVAPTPDYRYSHWTIVCVLLALTLRLARWRGSTGTAEVVGERGEIVGLATHAHAAPRS